MNVDAVGFLPVNQESVAQNSPAYGLDFGAWLQRQASDTNSKLLEADRWVQRLAVGEVDNLHTVMIALDEAKFNFQLLTQVRNKMLEAYQDILRMQI